MNRILAILGQLVLILAGYAAACLAASAFLNFVILGEVGFTPGHMPALFAGGLILSIPIVALFIGYFVFLPASAAILFAELFDRRSFLYHTSAGGLIGALVGGVTRGGQIMGADGADLIEIASQPDHDLHVLPHGTVILFFAGAGLVAGFVYWLVAGRMSGSWKGRPAPLDS